MFILLRLYLARLFHAKTPWLRLAVLLVALLLYGATAFLYFEAPQNPELRWSDGLWYSLVTMTTVGYGDFFPKTGAGRLLVGVPLMFVGIGLLGYVLSVIATTLVVQKNKEMKGMGNFKGSDHLVIFNYPSLVKVERIITELRLDPTVGPDAAVVLVDEDLQELPVELHVREVFFVRGIPTRDETLVRAGIDRARYAVILCKAPGDPHSDGLNLTITLAIESRGQKIHTVVECVDPSTEELLRKAGCDRVVCISRFDAHFLSQELLNPGIQEVIDDLLSSSYGQQIYLTPLRLDRPVSFAALNAVCTAQNHLAIGIRRSGKIHLNLNSDFSLAKEDHAITIGASRPGPFAIT